MFDFTGKRVLVTGGARGIGAATVAVGARSMVSYQNFIERTGFTDLHPAVGDISTRTAAQAVVAAAIGVLDGLDVLVNCAGIFQEIAIADVTQEHWDTTLATNLGGTFFCSQAALPALRGSRGNIVNVARPDSDDV